MCCLGSAAHARQYQYSVLAIPVFNRIPSSQVTPHKFTNLHNCPRNCLIRPYTKVNLTESLFFNDKQHSVF